MDICLASDENCLILMKVLIRSVIENNKESTINFHLFVSDMSQQSVDSLKKIESPKINVWIYELENEITKLRSQIKNKWAEKNSYMTYARLFMPYLLPKSVNKFLYLDCDTLVVSKLDDLFKMDLGENIVAGIMDVLPFFYKRYKGLENSCYINTGILLIDNDKWNQINASESILDYCLNHASDSYPDQDAINIFFKDKIKVLHPKYCVFYPEYSFPTKKQINGYGDRKSYYSQAQLIEAKNNPAIIHYVDTVLGRPWQSNNINPLSEKWLKYYDLAEENKKNDFKGRFVSKKENIFRLMYKILPKSIFADIYYSHRNHVIKNKMKDEG